MKSQKLLSFVCICILSVILAGSVGCSSMKAKPDAPTSSFKPMHIEFVSSLPSFVGSESISLVQILTLSNPNPFLVSVEVSYSLSINEENFGSSQVPKLYVPANTKINLRDTITFDYFTLLAGKLFGGKETPAEVASILLPIWKGLDGKIPARVKEEQWKEIKPAQPKFLLDAIVNVSNGKEEKNFFQKLTWSDK